MDVRHLHAGPISGWAVDLHPPDMYLVFLVCCHCLLCCHDAPSLGRLTRGLLSPLMCHWSSWPAMHCPARPCTAMHGPGLALTWPYTALPCTARPCIAIHGSGLVLRSPALHSPAMHGPGLVLHSPARPCPGLVLRGPGLAHLAMPWPGSPGHALPCLAPFKCLGGVPVDALCPSL